MLWYPLKISFLRGWRIWILWVTVLLFNFIFRWQYNHKDKLMEISLLNPPWLPLRKNIEINGSCFLLDGYYKVTKGRDKYWLYIHFITQLSCLKNPRHIVTWPQYNLDNSSAASLLNPFMYLRITLYYYNVILRNQKNI